MTTTYTSSLRLTNQEAGANASTWGDIADVNFEHIDDAIGGLVAVDLTGGTSHTLTTNNGSDDEARYAALYLHGVPSSANSIIIPAAQKSYIVQAVHTSVSGGLTVRTASGTGHSFLEGQSGIIYCNGVSAELVANVTPEVSALDPSANLADVADASASRTNLGMGSVAPFNIGTSANAVATVSAIKEVIFEVVYPIGTIYSNRTDGTNPGTLVGFGTWTSAGVGRVMIGVGTGTDANGVSATIASETSGGEYEHVLTSAELPAMTVVKQDSTTTAYQQTGFNTGSGSPQNGMGIVADTDLQRLVTRGGGGAHSLMQPYYSVFQWVRTA